jgi:hypothetical protein
MEEGRRERKNEQLREGGDDKVCVERGGREAGLVILMPKSQGHNWKFKSLNLWA